MAIKQKDKADPELTLGPVLFHWEAETWRDFYFKIAEETSLNTVYIGEVVCSKRKPFVDPHIPEVTKLLKASGKKVILTSLALVMNKRERNQIKELCSEEDITIEANDISTASFLSGKPHRIGPYVNVYNEDTMSFLAEKGAVHFCLPPELPAEKLEILANHARKIGVTTEIQIYGKIPLALSARCYHSRSHGLARDNCQFVCRNDPDGMDLDTMEDQQFLTVNGIQTMSRTCLNLSAHMDKLRDIGINCFRLSPQNCNMSNVSNIYKQLIDGGITVSEANKKLHNAGIDAPFSDGFFIGKCGHSYS